VTLYDRIGVGYDTTRRADPGVVGRLLDLLAVPGGGCCLDVACGTGNYTTALAQAGLQMIGVDVSRQMLASARARPGPVRWVNGDAAALPFADASFQAAVCTLALHHFCQPELVFREIARVLDDSGEGGGRLVCFTADPEQMRRYWLTTYFPDAMDQAIRQMPPLKQTLQLLAVAGFIRVAREPWSVTPELQDLFLYAGKYRPELYFDPRVRAGISTFANLADPIEIERGCARLRADLASGRFADVLRTAEHPDGDYLFLVATMKGTGDRG
jgi:ubiquinone/menaquinone biosynthesis C-methylase UbiE